MQNRVLVSKSRLFTSLFVMAVAMVQAPLGYEYGILPTRADQAHAVAAYEVFQKHFITEVGAGAGSLRVLRDDSLTVSEGQAYGMLLSAWLDSTSGTFEKLWRYAKRYHNSHGLMAWEIRSDGAISDVTNAPDGDLDMVPALYHASRKWNRPEWARDAADLARAIYVFNTGLHGFNAGYYQGFNPKWYWLDYQSPAYCALFAGLTGIDDFLKLKDDMHAFMNAALRHRSYPGGRVRPDGALEAASDNGYGIGQSRVIWRHAVDFLWHGDTASRGLLQRHYARHAAEQTTTGNPSSVRRVTWNYNATTGVSAYQGMSPVNVGAFGMAAMAAGDQKTLDECYDSLVNRSTHREPYFHASLKALYLLTLSGGFMRDAIPATPWPDTNLVVNGEFGFRTGKAPWTGTGSQSSHAYRLGLFAGLMMKDQTLDQTVRGLGPGATHRLVFFSKGSGSDSATIRWELDIPGRATLRGSVRAWDQWVRTQVEFQAGESDSATIRFSHPEYNWAYIDGVSLVRAETPSRIAAPLRGEGVAERLRWTETQWLGRDLRGRRTVQGDFFPLQGLRTTETQ